MRSMENRTEVSNSQIADFVCHLCLRTKHLRESFRSSTEFLIGKMEEYFSDYENIKKLMLRNPRLFQEELRKSFNEKPFPKPLKDRILRLAPHVLPKLLDQQKAAFQMLFRIFFARIRSEIPDAMKKGHIKALAKSTIPKPRTEDYRRLRWFLCKSELPLILGDLGCLFEIAGSKRFKTINDKDDQIKNIFLPISSNRILVGTALSDIPKVDPDMINQAISKCSREYFVCSNLSPSIVGLMSSIGDQSGILDRAELEQIIIDLTK